jgi:hypothetical protein
MGIVRLLRDTSTGNTFKVCFDNHGYIEDVYMYKKSGWEFLYSSAHFVKYFLTLNKRIREEAQLPKPFIYLESYEGCHGI